MDQIGMNLSQRATTQRIAFTKKSHRRATTAEWYLIRLEIIGQGSGRKGKKKGRMQRFHVEMLFYPFCLLRGARNPLSPSLLALALSCNGNHPRLGVWGISYIVPIF